jgi:DNA-binding XRE family transcriptional regulator
MNKRTERSIAAYFTVSPDDNKFRRARKEAQLSIEQLARQAGLSIKSIRRYEAGDRVPTLDILKRLCRALKRPPSELFTIPGTELLRERLDRLATTGEVAAATKIPLELYRQYEQGKVRVASGDAERLSRYFDVAIPDIFGPDQLTGARGDALLCPNYEAPLPAVPTLRTCPSCGRPVSKSLRRR